MSEKDIELIKNLAEKIKYNEATRGEYEQYINLLLSVGITQEKIDNTLRRGNIEDMNELYIVRKRMSSKIKIVNQQVIPALVGIGLGIVMAYEILEIIKASKKSD